MKRVLLRAGALALFGVLIGAVPSYAGDSVCGNGIKEADEQCDDGASGSTCCDVKCHVNPDCGCCETGGGPTTQVIASCYASTEAQCKGKYLSNSTCGLRGCEVTSVCGNETVEPGEQCDDGGTKDGDCCNSKCQFESSGSSCSDDKNTCTNDVCDGKGECAHEIKDPLPKECGCCEYAPSARNYYNPCQVTDSSSCFGEFSADAACTPYGCQGPVCGNGIVEEGEDCDIGGSSLGGLDGSAECCNSFTCKFEQAGTECNSDSEVCTDDVCDALGACTHVPNTASCGDELYCNGDEICGGGTCQAASPRDCGAGNTCSIASCDEANDQCVTTPDPGQNGQSCDDSNACTNGTTCSAGVCGGGTTLNCDDTNVCTADSCSAATGCVNTVTIESRTCNSCEDGVDNDSSGETDYADCSCNLLCESFDYALIGTRTTSRRTVYLGGDTHVDSAAISGGVGYDSRASVCVEREFAVIAEATVEGAAAARQNSVFGTGDNMQLGFFAGLVPPGKLKTTGNAPFVGPGGLVLTDPANLFPAGSVDLTGTHEEYTDCGVAIASLVPDRDALLALTPTVNLGAYTHKIGDPPLVVVGPGPHILNMTRLRVRGRAVLEISGDADSVVIVQVERGFSVAQRAGVQVGGGLRASNLLWVLDRAGRAYIGSDEEVETDDGDAVFAGTVLAPGRNIVVGKRSRISGSLLGRKVQLNGQAVVSHHPFTGVGP